MESLITLIAALLGFTATIIAVVGEFTRRRNREDEKNKVVVQVVYGPQGTPNIAVVNPEEPAVAAAQKVSTAVTAPPSPNKLPQATLRDAQKSKKPIHEPVVPKAEKLRQSTTDTAKKQAVLDLPTAKPVSAMTTVPAKASMQVGQFGEIFELTPRELEEIVANVQTGWARKYAVQIQGKLYPPKDVILEIMKKKKQPFTKTDFNTTQAIQLLKKLGFAILEKEGNVPEEDSEDDEQINDMTKPAEQTANSEDEGTSFKGKLAVPGLFWSSASSAIGSNVAQKEPVAQDKAPTSQPQPDSIAQETAELVKTPHTLRATPLAGVFNPTATASPPTSGQPANSESGFSSADPDKKKKSGRIVSPLFTDDKN